jgi:hypothetical protein
MILESFMGGDSQPYFVTEQAIEIREFLFRIICCPLTKFPLHFTHIHRSSPVPELPLRWKFLKAKGLRRWGLTFPGIVSDALFFEEFRLTI